MLVLQLDQVAHLTEQLGRKWEMHPNAPLSEAGQGTMDSNLSHSTLKNECHLCLMHRLRCPFKR